MQKIKHYIIALLLMATLVPVVAGASPLTQFAAKCPDGRILTVPAWYKGLECDGKQPKITALNDIWKIALNVVEALIGVAAYVAAAFVVWGGFKYMKSQGDPGQLTEAKNTIFQAMIGLGITLASTAIVIFVGSLF